MLLLETFVDPARFTGTCYRAAGWHELGLTRGFRKSNTRYVQHDRPKRILVVRLHPQAREILARPILDQIYQNGAVPQMKLNTKQTDSLFTSVVRLTDPRQLQGPRHTRRALTAIMFCVTLCGARGDEAISDWAKHLSQAMRKRLGCPKRVGRYIVPSCSTLYRFINAVDPCEVDKLLGLWVATFGDFLGTPRLSDFPRPCIIGVRLWTSRCGSRLHATWAVVGSPGSRVKCVGTCVGPLTAQSPAGTCEIAPTGVAFPILPQGRHSEERYVRGSIPSQPAPLSTLRGCGYPADSRMTRGRCGSLTLQL